jgi:hypothetical protein
MKLYQALLPLAAAMALAGCQGRGTAEGVIGRRKASSARSRTRRR